MIGYYGYCSGRHIYGYDMVDQYRLEALWRASGSISIQQSSGGTAGVPCVRNNAYDNYRPYINGIRSAHSNFIWLDRPMQYDVDMRATTSGPVVNPTITAPTASDPVAVITEPVSTLPPFGTLPTATVNPTSPVPTVVEEETERRSTSVSTYTGCGSCRTGFSPTVPNGQSSTRPPDPTLSKQQPPLMQLGPVTVPLQGSIKICWPCVAFWSMVTYLAVSGRRR